MTAAPKGVAGYRTKDHLMKKKKKNKNKKKNKKKKKKK